MLLSANQSSFAVKISMVNSQLIIVNSECLVSFVTTNTTIKKSPVIHYKFLLLLCLLFITSYAFTQTDKQNLTKTSLFNQTIDTTKPPITTKKITTKKDTAQAIKDTAKPKHDPRIATKRSLIFPGLGQIYNKEYWKLPIVYGALSIPTITYFYNNNFYKETKFAYEARFKAALPTGQGRDSTDYYSLETKYQRADVAAIQSVRNASR
ncbi:MAG: hypothetical protein H7101_10405, partial [Deinococcales bacterium]|nr:hypothetical protein [Chitinophagaceae bacterium]